MQQSGITENKKFVKEDFTGKLLPQGEYEKCTFSECDFSSADLSGTQFSNCLFTGCNLSLVKLVKVAFTQVKFKDCKLLGVHFENCNEYMVSFEFDSCMLNLSSFYKLNIRKTVFRNSIIHEADFTQADLLGAIFDQCDLAGSTFDKTNLEKADFRTAHNYSINPESNRIKKAKFSVHGISGLLHKYDIEIS